MRVPSHLLGPSCEILLIIGTIVKSNAILAIDHLKLILFCGCYDTTMLFNAIKVILS